MRLVGPPLPLKRHPTLVDALIAARDARSGVTFFDLNARETRFSWGEVVSSAERIAGGLRDLGVGRGERVALVFRTEPAFLHAFFGAWFAGAVPVPLYPPVRLGRFEEYVSSTARLVARSGARLVLSTGGLLRILCEAIARAKPELGGRDIGPLYGARKKLEPATAADLALVQYSSGSTVDPKPVALTHGALSAQVTALHAEIVPSERDAMVSWLPLYHDMGLIGALLGAASFPGPLVLISPENFLARPALWLVALSRYRGTVTSAPSFAYAYAADRVRDADLHGVSLRSVRFALDGAEPVSGSALRKFASRFGPWGLDPASLVPVYGLSEAALAVTFSRRGAPLEGRRVDPVVLARRGEVAPGEREIVPVGSPIAGVEVEIREAGGRLAGAGRLGTVFVRGPSVMAGYLGDPAATQAVLGNGWLDTGDLGFIADGALHLHGRSRDVVIVRGANHSADEFESALEGIEGLRPGCAVALGFEENGLGEGLVVLAERTRERVRSEEELRTAAHETILDRTGIAPREVRILEPGTLPRTSSGKLRRREALARLLSNTLTPPGPGGLFGLVLALARSELHRLRLSSSREER